ncbi:MAG: DUF4386 domain-containing protein [Cyclobacteriaceae bacterium]
MNSDQSIARIVGVLLLIIFGLGVTVFQVLQGPFLFVDDFLWQTSAHSFEVVLSTIFALLSGTLSLIISILLFPIFKKYSERLGYLYITFCLLYFVSMAIDNISVLSMLEVSKAYANAEATDLDTLEILGGLFYEIHSWTHHLSLFISCFPVFVLFLTLYISKLIPRVLSLFGMFAALMMMTQMLATVFGSSISGNMMLPIALIQLVFPIWLIIKGFSPRSGQ